MQTSALGLISDLWIWTCLVLHICRVSCVLQGGMWVLGGSSSMVTWWWMKAGKSPVCTGLSEGLWVLIGFYHTGKLWWPGPRITLVNTCPYAEMNCMSLRWYRLLPDPQFRLSCPTASHDPHLPPFSRTLGCPCSFWGRAPVLADTGPRERI